MPFQLIVSPPGLSLLGMVLASRLWAPEKPDIEARRPSWQRQGLCLDYPDVSWFPDRGEATGPAKAICARCPVRGECLNYALSVGSSLQGVWAGTSQQERRRLGKIVSTGASGGRP